MINGPGGGGFLPPILDPDKFSAGPYNPQIEIAEHPSAIHLLGPAPSRRGSGRGAGRGDEVVPIRLRANTSKTTAAAAADAPGPYLSHQTTPRYPSIGHHDGAPVDVSALWLIQSSEERPTAPDRVVRSPFIERTVYNRGAKDNLIFWGAWGVLTAAVIALTTRMPLIMFYLDYDAQFGYRHSWALIIEVIAVFSSWLILTVGLTWRAHDN